MLANVQNTAYILIGNSKGRVHGNGNTKVLVKLKSYSKYENKNKANWNTKV